MDDPDAPDDAPTDIAAGLIAQLDAEAEFVDAGGFTLDHQLARDKLATHRLAEPQSFVLLLVEVAHLLDCAEIGFESRSGATVARLEGAWLSEDELRGLFDAVFVRRSGLEPDARRRVDARRMLAVCAETLLGSGGEGVELVSVGPEGEALVLSVQSNGSTAIEAGESDRHETGPSLAFVVHDPRQAWALARDHDAVFAARETLIRTRCRYAVRPVLVRGERVSIGLELPELATHVDERPPFVFAAGWSPARRQATILFVVNGVLIETLELADAPAGALALVDAEPLERDLSLFKLRRDKAFDAHLTAVLELFDRVATEDAPRLAPISVGNHTVPDFIAGVLVLIVGLATLALIKILNSGVSVVLLICAALAAGTKGVLIMRRAIGFGRERLLLRRGVEGSATIHAIKPAPFPYSQEDLLHLQVRLEQVDHAPVETQIEIWEPAGVAKTRLAIGARYLARVDPEDSQRAVLEPVP